MLVHSLASKYARFVFIVRQIYWTPPFRPLDPPLLKSDDLFFREPRDIGPPPFKNPGHAPGYVYVRPNVTPWNLTFACLAWQKATSGTTRLKISPCIKTYFKFLPHDSKVNKTSILFPNCFHFMIYQL